MVHQEKLNHSSLLLLMCINMISPVWSKCLVVAKYLYTLYNILSMWSLYFYTTSLDYMITETLYVSQQG